jgi:ribosomal protein S7
MTKAIYTNFLGFLTKKGNKVTAKKILDEAFLDVSLKTNQSGHILLIKVFLKLNSFVETKKIKFKRGTHIVPFVITSFKRKSYLIIKWLMEAVEQDNRKISIAKKLSKEILNILKNQSSKTLMKKKLNVKNALLNRSNIHFRW